jgi:hypothetical protein
MPLSGRRSCPSAVSLPPGCQPARPACGLARFSSSVSIPPPPPPPYLCSFPLVPAAADMYLMNKSSSTVAAAIHVGTPLVADER